MRHSPSESDGECRMSRARASVDAEQDGAGGGEPSAGAVDAADLGIGDLALTRLAAELPHGLDEQEHAAHARVAARQTAAVGVRGQRATDAQLAVLDERTALALLAEPEGLEREQHHGRE